MVKLIHHNIVKIFRLEIFIIQISCIPQCRNRCKDHRLVRAFIGAVEEAIIITVPHISERLCRLLQYLFTMCDEENSLVVSGVECGEVCFTNAGGSLHQALHSTFGAGILQRTKCLDLRTSGLIEDMHLRVSILFALIIAVEILNGRRPVPALGILPKLLIIDHNRMMIEEVLESVIELLVILLVCPAAEAIIPLNSGRQRAPRYIRRANIDVAVIRIMEYVGLGMKRPLLLIIKAQVHPISQLLLDQIQRGRLCDSQIITRKDAHLRPLIHRPLKILKQHFHPRLHQERHDDIDALCILHAVDQLIIQVHALVTVAGGDEG